MAHITPKPYITHYSSFHFLFHYPNITPTYPYKEFRLWLLWLPSFSREGLQPAIVPPQAAFQKGKQTTCGWSRLLATTLKRGWRTALGRRRSTNDLLFRGTLRQPSFEGLGQPPPPGVPGSLKLAALCNSQPLSMDPYQSRRPRSHIPLSPP